MEKVEIHALLALAEKIQNALLNEVDEKAIKCLENDLEKVKMGIAERVFDLPLDVSIFDDEICSDSNNSGLIDTFETSSLDLSVEKLDTDSTEQDEFEPNEEQLKAEKDFTEKEIAKKFSKFINSKKKTTKTSKRTPALVE